MPKDTKSLGNNKAPACESRGFVRKRKKGCILTHLPVADRTVHCNGLYSPLPETVVIRRTDGHNRKDENAWSD